MPYARRRRRKRYTFGQRVRAVGKRIRKYKPVRRAFKRGARAIGMGSTLDPILNLIPFRKERFIQQKNPFLQAIRQKKKRRASKSPRTHGRLTAADMAVVQHGYDMDVDMDEQKGAVNQNLRMPYRRKRMYGRTNRGPAKRRKTKFHTYNVAKRKAAYGKLNQRVNMLAHALAYTRKMLYKKIAWGNTPIQEFRKVSTAQVAVADNARGSYELGLCTWSGDLIGTVLPNARLVNMADSTAVLTIVDPALEANANKVPVKMRMVTSWKAVVMRNNSLHDVVVRWFRFSPRIDLEPTNTYGYTWRMDLSSDDGPAKSNVAIANMLATYAAHPKLSSLLRQRFKTWKSGVVRLRPGQESKFLLIQKKPRIIDISNMAERAVNCESGTLYYAKGFSSGLYFMMEGALAHDTTTTTNVGTADMVVDIKVSEVYKWQIQTANSIEYKQMYTTFGSVVGGMIQAGAEEEND